MKHSESAFRDAPPTDDGQEYLDRIPAGHTNGKPRPVAAEAPPSIA